MCLKLSHGIRTLQRNKCPFFVQIPVSGDDPLVKSKAVHHKRSLLHARPLHIRRDRSRDQRQNQRQDSIGSGIVKRNHKRCRLKKDSRGSADGQRSDQFPQKSRQIQPAPAVSYRFYKFTLFHMAPPRSIFYSLFINPIGHFFLLPDAFMGFTLHAAAIMNRSDRSRIHAADKNIHVFP